MTNVVAQKLKSELELRKKRNPSYSLRSFARNLGLSPAQLSQIISGKRPLTTKALHKITAKLGLSPAEKRHLWQSHVEGPETSFKTKSILLHEDQFRLISDWYHLAILSLSYLKGAKNDPYWIHQKLGISLQEARLATARLIRMGILEDSKKLIQKTDPFSVISDVPSEGIRKFHRQILNLGLDCLETVALSKRDYSALCFPFNTKNIDKIRSQIELFQKQILEEFQGDEDVYMLSIQLFPVTPKGVSK